VAWTAWLRKVWAAQVAWSRVAHRARWATYAFFAYAFLQLFASAQGGGGIDSAQRYLQVILGSVVALPLVLLPLAAILWIARSTLPDLPVVEPKVRWGWSRVAAAVAAAALVVKVWSTARQMPTPPGLSLFDALGFPAALLLGPLAFREAKAQMFPPPSTQPLVPAPERAVAPAQSPAPIQPTAVEMALGRLCSQCGAPNLQRAKFCMECGNPMAPRCRNCKADLGKAKFCPECGAQA